MSRQVGLLVKDGRLAIPGDALESCVRSLDACPVFVVAPGSIEVAFVDEPSCCQLHNDFFNDPEVTDVMTFPGDPEDQHAGDIAICPAVAAIACAESGLPFNEELTLYLVHAWLHLAGLKDHDPEHQKEMRAGENLLMEHLRSNRTLLPCTWSP